MLNAAAASVCAAPTAVTKRRDGRRSDPTRSAAALGARCYRGIGIESDRDLQDEALAALEWEPGVNAAQIGVTVRDGVVTLRGAVSTLQKTLIAERSKRRLVGVRALANDLGDGDLIGVFEEAPSSRALRDVSWAGTKVGRHQAELIIDGEGSAEAGERHVVCTRHRQDKRAVRRRQTDRVDAARTVRFSGGGN
jgi:BON domain